MTAPRGGGILLRSCEVGEQLGLDVRIRGGMVTEVGPGLVPAPHDEVIDGAGGALIPGLHDHHIHLLSLAASLSSVRCGPPEVTTPGDLAAALTAAAAVTTPGQWIRGIGYHESVAGPLDRWSLDAMVPDRPVRIQHRSGSLWMLSSAALAAAGLLPDNVAAADIAGMERSSAGQPTGRLFRHDNELRDRIPRHAVDLGAVGHLLAAAGVTGVTDATPALTASAAAALAGAVAGGAIPQRVTALGLGSTATGPAGAPGMAVGPHKIVLDEGRGLDLATLTADVRRAHDGGRAVAIHAVTVAEVLVAIEAVAQAGARAGDRLEHASELPREADATVLELGLTVVTQPNFIAERGDEYLTDVAPAEQAILYRCASLLASGIAVAGGTDAPFGRPDPWLAMAAAVDRRTPAGVVLGPDERVPARRALDLFLGPPLGPGGPARTVSPHTPADLCLLHEPLAVALRRPSRDGVRATIINGEIVHS